MTSDAVDFHCVNPSPPTSHINVVSLGGGSKCYCDSDLSRRVVCLS